MLVTPAQVLFSVILLLMLLGPPMLVGISILVCNILLVERLGNEIKVAQMAKNKAADKRSIVLNESMQGIRTIKLNAWEVRARRERAMTHDGAAMTRDDVARARLRRAVWS